MIDLIFIHINKTGGKSFRQILVGEYGKEVCFRIRPAIKLHRNPGKTLRQLVPQQTRVLMGHFTFREILPLYTPGHTRVITWVREPVERVISHFYYFKYKIWSGHRPQYDDRRNESLLEFARKPEYRNLIARSLEGLLLERFAFLGCTEHYEEDLKTAIRRFGWESAQPVRINDNREFKLQFEPVSQEVRKEIAFLNARDLEIYEQVKQLRLKAKA